MTRWARHNVQKKSAHEASSWKDLKRKQCAKTGIIHK